eukprot:6187945-Pleurochrysis_carterae.AAC.3
MRQAGRVRFRAGRACRWRGVLQAFRCVGAAGAFSARRCRPTSLGCATWPGTSGWPGRVASRVRVRHAESRAIRRDLRVG